jgi:hypothetical protein
MSGHLRQGDFLAGVVAAAALLLLLSLGVTPRLAIPLAVATYAGLALLRPRRGHGRDKTVDQASRLQLAYQTALTRAASIRALERRIAKPAVRE